MKEGHQEKIRSISDMLNFFKNTKEHLFYIGRIYCTAPLDLHDFMPNFEIITCFDPFNQRFPFITVPRSLREASQPHKCIDFQCQRAILRDPETIAYMRSKAPRPNVFYMMTRDPIAGEMVRKNNFNLFSAPHEVKAIIGNKVKVVQHLKRAGIPYIANVCGKFRNYQEFRQMIKPLGTENVVAQIEVGVSGYGTYFIENKQAYERQREALEDQQYQKKIAPFKKLKSFGISAVTTRFGTIIGPLHAQIIGHPKLTRQRAGFCGNQQRNDYFQDKQVERKVRGEIYAITKRFGDYVYKERIFRGMFGIDFAVDIDTHEVFVMEINPRMTGSMTTSFQIYQAQGFHFPHLLYHCLQYLDKDAWLDVEDLNKEWQDLKHYWQPRTHLTLKPMNEQEMNLSIRIPPGVWKIQDGEAKFTGRFTYKYSELGEGEFFFLPNHGFSKGNLFMNKKCQDFNRKLTPEVQQIIDKFLQLIAKYNHP